MIITRKHLSRRTVLRGLGTTLALPLLDSMVPAFAAVRQTAATPVRRLGVVYFGHGAHMAQWTPATTGALELSPILQGLAPFQDRLLVLSGLGSKPGTGVHAQIQAAYLTGVSPKRTDGSDVEAGVSMDQIAATELGRETQLPSLELSAEPIDFSSGSTCAFAFSCIYNNTVSWRTPTTPMPMENNPRALFERLFGAADSTQAGARLADVQIDRSLLDSVTDEVSNLQRQLGTSDRTRLDQFLETVRDVERRLQKAEAQADRELPFVERPAGVPATFPEQTALMFDLLALAYQTDLTRVSTYLLIRENSLRTAPEIGVPESYHPMTHSGTPTWREKQAKLNVYHLQLFRHFLETLEATPDGDGSLLDHTLLLYGSGMSDASIHTPYNLPTLLVGGRTFFKGGRHVRVPEKTPVTNLHLTLLDKMGVRVDRLGDSSGQVNLLSDV